MPSRFPLKRSKSSDTIDSADSFNTMDNDTSFVDRVCNKMKKAASPFSTLFVAGTNRSTTCDSAVFKEKRVGISLSSLRRRGSNQQSVFTQETTDIWKIVDVTLDTGENQYEESFYSEEESGNDNGEHECCDSSSDDNNHSSQSSAIVLKRRLHRRLSFDDEFRRREEDRRRARTTAAALVRKRNLQRRTLHREGSRDSELCRRSHHRNTAERKPRICSQ